MELIGRGQMGRQGGEVSAFKLKGFGRDESRLALGLMVHAHGRPGQSLLVDVLQAGKGAAGEEVGLHRPEAALLAGFAVGVVQFVATEDKPVLLGEGLHLRGDYRPAPNAPQPRQIGVVDNALAGGVAPEQERLVEEALHLEAIKSAVKPEVTTFTVTQVDQAGDEFDPPAPQLDLIEAGVMLHLQPRLIGHPVAAGLWGVADAQLPEPSGQGRIAHLDPLLLHELLMHSRHPALALLVELAQEFLIQPLLVGTHRPRHRALLPDDGSNRVAAQGQAAGNLPRFHPFLVEHENRLTLVRCDHGVASRCEKMLATGLKSLPLTNGTARERRGSPAAGPGSCP